MDAFFFLTTFDDNEFSFRRIRLSCNYSLVMTIIANRVWADRHLRSRFRPLTQSLVVNQISIFLPIYLFYQDESAKEMTVPTSQISDLDYRYTQTINHKALFLLEPTSSHSLSGAISLPVSIETQFW